VKISNVNWRFVIKICINNKQFKSKMQSHNTPMEAKGERIYSSYSFTTSAWYGVSGQRHASAALYPQEKTSGTHCTGGWVDLRAGQDTEARGKILCPCRGSNLDRPVVQSVVRHYTDWATRLLVFEFTSIIISMASITSMAVIRTSEVGASLDVVPEILCGNRAWKNNTQLFVVKIIV
jgi:hypothetical protein